MTEHPNPREEEFGADRVAALLATAPEETPADLGTRLEHHLRRHAAGCEAGDDVTWLALRRTWIPD